MQYDLFETEDSIQLDDSPVDFEKTTKDLTDKASQTDDLNNSLEVELKRLKHSVKELRESYGKNMQSHFTTLYPQMNYATIIQDFHQLTF